MIDKPQITQTADQLTAVIRLTIPRPEIRIVMGPGVRELMAAVAAQGIAPTGPWFSHHLRTDPDIFDFEISVPVGPQVARRGPRRAGKMARHEGSADGLPWGLRGPRRRMARVQRLDRGRWAQDWLGLLGMLRHWPGVEPGPERLAYRTHPTADRL